MLNYQRVWILWGSDRGKQWDFNREKFQKFIGTKKNQWGIHRFHPCAAHHLGLADPTLEVHLRNHRSIPWGSLITFLTGAISIVFLFCPWVVTSGSSRKGIRPIHQCRSTDDSYSSWFHTPFSLLNSKMVCLKMGHRWITLNSSMHYRIYTYIYIIYLLLSSLLSLKIYFSRHSINFKWQILVNIPHVLKHNTSWLISHQLFWTCLPCEKNKILLVNYRSTWGFPKMGIPPDHPFIDGFFISETLHFWGSTILGKLHFPSEYNNFPIYSQLS